MPARARARPAPASTGARSPTARASRCAPTSRWPSTAWRAAARADGVALLINSAFRSDAEQAQLFAAHPDPKWVAPPGRSLHRLGTELDLGPPAAYGWLAAHAERFHFLQRTIRVEEATVGPLNGAPGSTSSTVSHVGPPGGDGLRLFDEQGDRVVGADGRLQLVEAVA